MPAFSVSESILIDSPIDEVHRLVFDFKEWVPWSPWLSAEPDCKLDYSEDGKSYSWDGKVIDQIAPFFDEIVLPKGSSSVFVSTHIDYILRNLGVRQLVISGLLTDQCVESAIRDACDLGYLVTQVTDACLTMTEARHDNSINTIKGYCRQLTTEELLKELQEYR